MTCARSQARRSPYNRRRMFARNVQRLRRPLRRYPWQQHRGVAAILLPLWLTACSSQSDVERQRASNVAAAEQEALPLPFQSLRRSGELTRDDRAAWRKRLQWPDACEQDFASTPGSTAGLTFHAAGSGITLVEVRCGSTDLQPTQLFVRLDERGSSPTVTVLDFPGVPVSGGRPGEPSGGLAGEPHDRATSHRVMGQAVVGAAGHTISVLTLARSAGDCGTWVRYAVGSEHPRIAAASSNLPCPASAGAAARMGQDGESPAGWPPIANAR